MNRLFFASLFAFAAVLSADDAPLTGKWQVHTSIADHENEQVCSFKQTGNDLSGTCSSDHGALKVTGKVEDKNVSWMYKSEYEGTPLTVNFDGTLNADNKIAGTVTVPEFSVDGDFTATPDK